MGGGRPIKRLRWSLWYGEPGYINITWLPAAAPTGSGSITIFALESAVVPTALAVKTHLSRLPPSKSSNFCQSAKALVPDDSSRAAARRDFVFIGGNGSNGRWGIGIQAGAKSSGGRATQ